MTTDGSLRTSHRDLERSTSGHVQTVADSHQALPLDLEDRSRAAQQVFLELGGIVGAGDHHRRHHNSTRSGAGVVVARLGGEGTAAGLVLFPTQLAARGRWREKEQERD